MDSPKSIQHVPTDHPSVEVVKRCGLDLKQGLNFFALGGARDFGLILMADNNPVAMSTILTAEQMFTLIETLQELVNFAGHHQTHDRR